MKNFVLAICAASAVALASPAVAAPEITITQPTGGTPYSAQIYGVANDTPASIQYGTEPDNGGATNVTFTGNSNFIIKNGFAQLIEGTSLLTSLTIDPNRLFTDMKIAFSLTGTGNFDSPVSVYYLLSGPGSSNTLAGTVNGGGNNDNFEINVTGGLFDSITITSTGGHGFASVRQVSFNPVAPVPEPATWAMMLLGFGGIGLTIRRKQRRNGALMQVA